MDRPPLGDGSQILLKPFHPLALEGGTTALTEDPGKGHDWVLFDIECDGKARPRALLDIGPDQKSPVPPGSSGADQFSAFVKEAQPRLLRALVGYFGPDDAHDAMADALAYAWEHWIRVSTMDNAAGYVYRVAISRGRRLWRKAGKESIFTDDVMPNVEPGLPSAMRQLSPRQRTAVFLVHGCEWSHEEVADLMGISVSSVRNHLARGMTHLRNLIGDTKEETLK